MKIIVGENLLEQVRNFKYLASLLRLNDDISKRNAIIKGKFKNITITTTKNLLVTKTTLFSFRKWIAECYVPSILLNGVETWKLRKIEVKYLESFEMWSVEKSVRGIV